MESLYYSTITLPDLPRDALNIIITMLHPATQLLLCTTCKLFRNILTQNKILNMLPMKMKDQLTYHACNNHRSVFNFFLWLEYNINCRRNNNTTDQTVFTFPWHELNCLQQYTKWHREESSSRFNQIHYEEAVESGNLCKLRYLLHCKRYKETKNYVPKLVQIAYQYGHVHILDFFTKPREYDSPPYIYICSTVFSGVPKNNQDAVTEWLHKKGL